ncbi:dirigent protein 19 [Vigna unguiculata]|uniref:Dirigent protein n=1 Tax=Vigna unguiculata TaxID=3917 RepID=A0A4D6LAI7_VIGUN|nr:dirigent protein 19 [Vigna unguiculata]QCD85406.1 Plant disease resistance response protein [Vigna unguiculata]
MSARIIFCVAISLATLAVIVLAVLSPVTSHNKTHHARSWLDLSFYIQQPQISSTLNTHLVPREDGGALIFPRVLTEGPEKSSRVVGRAQGFVILGDMFQRSLFDVMYLSFDTPHHKGSLSVQAHEDKQRFKVIGGTGSFAFARGVAVFTRTDEAAATYHLKLQLQFPNRSPNSLPT